MDKWLENREKFYRSYMTEEQFKEFETAILSGEKFVGRVEIMKEEYLSDESVFEARLQQEVSALITDIRALRKYALKKRENVG